MRDFVYGKDVIIEAWKDNNYYPFACAEEVSIKVTSELLPTNTPDTGVWDYYKPSGKNGWSMTMTGVTVLTDPASTLWYAWETLKYQLRTTGLDIKIRFIDRNGFEMTAIGHVKIPESEIGGRADDFSRFAVQFQGSGPLDINGLSIPTINPNVKRIDWITTGAEPNKVQDNFLIGRSASEIMQVSLEGDDKFQVIASGEPTHKQVRLDSGEGSLRFAIDFDPEWFIYAIVIND